MRSTTLSSRSLFLSTPSARRATDCPRLDNTRHKFLSTPSARRATDKRGLTQRAVAISIHALREEGDRSRPWCGSGRSYFYPRPPRGGRLYELLCIYIDVMISIHALREEGDVATVSLLPLNSISIHALREEGDPSGYYRGWFPEKFLSTPSARRATGLPRSPTTPTKISIHALREEGDAVGPAAAAAHDYFYPRPPRGGRPLASAAYARRVDISIHALREEGDRAV